MREIQLLGLELGVLAASHFCPGLFRLVSFSSCIPSLLHILLLSTFLFPFSLFRLHSPDLVPGCYSHTGRCIDSTSAQRGPP